jgi:hypothetical protein
MADESPTSAMGPRELYHPRRELLASLSSTGGGGGTIRFRVDIPDPRLRVQIAIRAAPSDQGQKPSTCLALRNGTLWLSTLEDDEGDGGDASGLGTPVNNLEGSSTAPISFPLDAGLGGYGREFSTLGNAIQGVIVFPVQAAHANTACKLWLQSRFAPQVRQIIPWPLWEELRAQCKQSVLSEALIS